MADNNQDFKINIVTSADVSGFKQASAASEELKQSTEDITTHLPEGAEAWSKYKNVLGQTSEGGKLFSMEGRGMKQVMNELDNVVPGLGKSIEGLHKTIIGAGGGLVVVQLAIEATKLYWDMYQESQAKAAEQTATKFDRIRSVARDALAEIEDYKARLDKATKPEDAVGDKLANDRAVLAAQFAGKRKLATTDEERAAIDSQQEAAQIALLKSTISTLEEQKSKDEAERARLEEERKEVVGDRGSKMKWGLDTSAEDSKIAQLTGKMAEVGNRITDAQTRITRYSGEMGTQESVHGVNEFTRSAVQNPTVAKAVMAGGFSSGGSGTALTDEQRNANTELTKLFSQYQGGIAEMQKVIAYHLQHSTTQAQQIEALKNTLATLQRTGRR
jgi:hypothetical protein